MAPVHALTSARIAHAYAVAKSKQAFAAEDHRELGFRLAAITDAHPHLNAPTAIALAEQGYTYDSPEVRTVARLQMRKDQQDHGLWGSIKHAASEVSDAAKVGVRVGTAALEAPIQSEKAAIRGVLSNPGEFFDPGSWTPGGGMGARLSGQTTIGAAAEVSQQTGGEVSIPEALNNLPQMGRDRNPATLAQRKQNTWFSGPNSLAEKQQVANARAAGLTFDPTHPQGRATTFGRWLGTKIGAEPGGVANSILGHILNFGAIHDEPQPLTAQDRARMRAAGLAPDAVITPEGDGTISPERVQSIIEGGPDALLTVYGDPVNAASAHVTQLNRLRGVYRGATTAEDVEQYARTVAKVTDKVTRETRDVPLVVNTGTRKTVVFENAADHILRSRKGDRLAQWAAKANRYEDVARVFGRDTRPETILSILDETDPERMKHVLLGAVGDGFIRKAAKPNAADLTSVGLDPIGGRFAGWASAKLTRPTSRWRQLAPSEIRLPKSDPTWAVEQYRRQLHAIKSGALKDTFNDEYISRSVEKFARQLVDPTGDPVQTMIQVGDTVRDALVAHGVDPQHARTLGHVFTERNVEERLGWIDHHSGEVKTATMHVGGEDLPIPSAAASAEMFTDGIPMLHHEQIRQMASSMHRLYATKGWEDAVAAGEFTTALFKALVLPARGGAWALRNVSEASGRLAFEGVDGILNSPLAALGYIVGQTPDSATARILGKWNRLVAKGLVDPAGDNPRERAELLGDMSKWARAMEHRGGPYASEGVVYTDGIGKARRWYEPGENGAMIEQRDPDWLEGQRFNLAKLSGSPEFRMAIDAENPQHAKNMFWNSDTRKQMAHQQPALNTREGADAWMDQYVYARLDDFQHPDLRRAIRQGHLNGVPLSRTNARGQITHDRQILNELDKYAEHLPDYTTAPKTASGLRGLGPLAKNVHRFERGTLQSLYAAFGSDPMNKFVNAPFMSQATWQEAAQLAPLASAAERAKMAAAARKARQPRDIIRQIEQVKGPAGHLTAKEVRDIAEGRAFDRWMHTMYNSHLKGNWSYSMRLLQPFAAAVADMYRFWGKKLVQNPLVLHRVEQGMQGARGAGFVYVDDNGEERFAYPFTRGWAAAAAGVDAVFTGTVKGANMITSGLLPGFGPVATWPVAWMLPDEKETDTIRRFINPYGDPDAGGGVFEGLAPGNVQKVLTALGHGSPEQKRRFMELQADVMTYLAATGRYGNSLDEQRRMRDEAHDKAKALYLLQGMAQASLPASPRAEVYMTDPTGRRVAIAMVAADYRRWMREDKATATQKLLQTYGEAAFYAVAGGTAGTSQMTTEAAHDLAREHPEVTDKYDLVWSFFTDPSSPYSHEEFKRQLNTGDRRVRSLKEREVAAQTSLANSMLFTYKDQFGPFPTPEENDYLNYVKGELKKKYPLWDRSFDVNEVQSRVKQAFQAANDPAFKDTEVAAAVRSYEKARAQVRDFYNQSGVTDSETGWGKAKAAADGRDYLRFLAQQLTEKTPEFGTLWQRVFDPEMVDDVEGQS